jgi:hypothetical protein
VEDIHYWRDRNCVMQQQILLAIVGFVVLFTLFVNLYHPQLQVGGLHDSPIPHGIHSMATDKMNIPPVPIPVVTELLRTPPPALRSVSREPEPVAVLAKNEGNDKKANEVVTFQVTGEEVVHYDDKQYLAYLQKSKTTFQNHLGHSLIKQKELSLDDYMLLLSKQPECATRPIFMSMARVSSDLYWQLIENFFYSMYYFDNLVSWCDFHIYLYSTDTYYRA